MKKNYVTSTNFTDNADKIRTLKEDHYIGLLAFAKEGAVFYNKFPERPAAISTRGSTIEFSAICKRCVITVAEYSFDNYAVVITSLGVPDLVFHCDNKQQANNNGLLLFFAKPGAENLKVRLIYNRASSQGCMAFRVEEISDMWVFKGLLEPLLVNNGFRFNWKRLYEIIWGHPIICKKLEELEEGTDVQNS